MRNFINLLFLGTFGWGVSLFLIKILLHCLSPVEIVFYRVALGAIALWALAMVSGIAIIKSKSLWRDGIVMGVFNMALPFYLISYAEQTVSGSLSAVINAMTPIFTVLVGVTFFSAQSQLNIYILTGIATGLGGVLLINADAFRHHQLSFHLLGLVIACVSYAVAINYQRHYAASNQPVVIAAIATSVAAMIMLLLQWQTGTLHWHVPDQGYEWIVLMWLGLIATGFSMYLYFMLIRNAGTVYASMVTYLMTATSVLTGVILFHEEMSKVTLLGCVCIAASLCLMNLRKNPA